VIVFMAGEIGKTRQDILLNHSDSSERAPRPPPRASGSLSR
jgi:hypothetical protein